MIEVIYDKNETNSNEIDATLDLGMKLPKNIRQVGTPNGNRRIYIEDYVVTYLNFISRPGSTHARGAILLGEYKKSDIGDIVFISGAVDAQNIEFDLEATEFNNDIWTEIYDQIKENFPDLAIVGWFLSRMGFSTAVNEKISKLHVDNFSGKEKVLYIIDSLEGDDAFYVYERGQLVKQKGYYIYYSKNEEMQNYIIKQKGGVSEEEKTEIKRKDEELIKNYRNIHDKIKDKKETSSGGLLYVASSFVVLAMLAMGVTVISNYDKMKQMEVSLNRLELTAQEQSNKEEVTPALAEIGTNDATNSSLTTVENGEETQTTSTEISDETTSSEEPISSEEATTQEGTEEEISTEQTLPAITDGNATYYLVKDGDTLSSISDEMYGSIIYSKNIADANGLDNGDVIYTGQSLLIPTINTSVEE